MKEPFYSIACWSIRLSPVLIMGTVWLLCHYRFPHFQKVWIVLGIGYLTGVLSVWIYWDFAASYAPTEEIADEILSKDGAPQVFAPFVMPIFVGIYFALMWPITWLVTRICPRKELAPGNPQP
ncbi:MAG: hypothetical protein VX839_04365 [Verrucomicrobiota bacterium]|nr:hypothetical protein [Verrucomicrobiota bacterium]